MVRHVPALSGAARRAPHLRGGGAGICEAERPQSALPASGERTPGVRAAGVRPGSAPLCGGSVGTVGQGSAVFEG